MKLIILCLSIQKNKLSIVMASVICSHISIRKKGIRGFSNGKCHMFRIHHTKRIYYWAYNVKCTMCTDLGTLETIVLHSYTPHTMIEHTHAKILVSAFECQVP